MPQMRRVELGKVKVGEGLPLALVAGPCVIESESMCLDVAREIKGIAARVGMPFVFKASFDKANRSSISSFRGPGPEEGLRILRKVREEVGVPVISDVHEVAQVAPAAEALDALQIPAFLCRQTDLLVAAAKSGRPVNVKKGQFMAPLDMANVIDKLRDSGCRKVLLTERGVSFGYNRLVVDMAGISAMQSLGVPVLFDATHSVQQPGAEKTRSGGDRAMVPVLARAAVAAGASGVFIEVHPEPAKARSDAATQWPLDELEPLLRTLAEIRSIIIEIEI